MQNSALGALPRDPKARLKKAAHSMEALWLTDMLKEARPKGGMFSKSFASSTFQDMMSQQLAQNIADTGLLGLSDSLSRQLLHTQSEISKTQSGLAGEGSDASPANSASHPAAAVAPISSGTSKK